MRRNILISITILITLSAQAKLSSPETDAKFTRLSDGRELKDITVSGKKLYLVKGSGEKFGTTAQNLYQKIYQDSKEKENYPVQWVLRNLSNGQVIDGSRSWSQKQYGASVSKIFVAATLLDLQGVSISKSNLQRMADMITVSSNTAWIDLQKQIGGGSADLGRQRNYEFTQRMGYERTVGFQGYWGDMHGNELTAEELSLFLYDTYQERYPGAEVLWKLMHCTRTGTDRALKYLPANLYVGGKTGTYSGETVDPETGATKGQNGKPYKVNVKHHVIVFYKGGNQYALTILSNSGLNESAAALTGGLYQKYF